MTEEHITQVETPDGNTHATTTIVSDEPRSGGGGVGLWIGLIMLVLAVIAGIWLMSGVNNAEIAKDQAIAVEQTADKINGE